MPLPSIKRIRRSAFRALFNPGWKEQALRSRQLSAAVTRFQHRTIYRELTVQILCGISDDDLVQAVQDCVESKLPQGHVGVLPPGLGVHRGCMSIYYYRTMDYEVWNSGFDHWLRGSSSELVVHTTEALRFLGLAAMAGTLEEAQQRFNCGRSIARCCARYLRAQAEAEPQIVRFIREHPDEFTTTGKD